MNIHQEAKKTNDETFWDRTKMSQKSCRKIVKSEKEKITNNKNKKGKEAIGR